VFLEAVRFMPDVEAIQELQLRRETGLEELAMLKTVLHDLELEGAQKSNPKVMAAGRAIEIVNTDLARLNMAIKECNKRIENWYWQKAVTAVYGAEGYQRCRIWMYQNCPERFNDDPKTAQHYAKLLDQYGIGPSEGTAA